MFTGIVEVRSRVVSRRQRAGGRRLLVARPASFRRVTRGQSVAVNGVCLSVADLRRGTLAFDVIAETLRATTLGSVGPGDRVNLERSLPVDGRFEGHLVLGHVDGTGTVSGRRRTSRECWLDITAEPALVSQLVSKGPVAVDGVSLTVGRELATTSFRVYLIPHTLRVTTLGDRRVGDRVNLEIDLFAKYVRGLVRPPLRSRRGVRGLAMRPATGRR